MNKDLNKKNAAAVFEKNKGIKQLYFTNDGQAFTSIEPAKTHQKEVTGNIEGLHLVKNGNYEGPAVSLIEDVVTAAPEEAEAEEVTADEAGTGKKKNHKQ